MGSRCASVLLAGMNMLKQIDDYPALLDACWQEHLAPRSADAPTVISTFAGGGGSSLGYSMAGYRELLAVEWDDNAVETFQLNFPDVPVYHGDIAKLSVEECMRLAGLTGPGELDVLDGSPPCQGFSTAGKRDFGDDRNQLFRQYVRLLRGLRPKVFVMENVSGMVKGIMKLIFADTMRELKASGYIVSARLLNAMYFNVPQSRERMIFIGVRDDLGVVPSHPKAESRPVTIRGALSHIATMHFQSMGVESSRVFDVSSEPMCTIRKAGGGQQTRYFVTDSEADISRFAIGDEWDRLKPGEKSSKYLSLVRADKNKPSPTLTKTGSTLSAASVTHPSEKRKFYAWELKRLASFPDDFSLVGGYSDAWNRIGNSVPPLFMRSIAEHIRREILGNGCR